MLRACLLLSALALAGCGFEEPPAPSSGGAVTPPAVSPPTVTDPCTDIVLTLLDGQLNGLPSADPATFDKAGLIADQFQARYDAVIAGSGVEAARAQYAAEVSAACTG